MPTILHPGVYLEEIPSGAKPIEGVSTSIAAFVGPAERGPADEPVLIHSLEQYTATYGAVASTADAMGLSVAAFFQNGGKDAYIARLVGTGQRVPSFFTLRAGTTDVLTVTASSVGDWGDKVHVRVPRPADSTFILEVGHRENGKFVADESFAGLSMDPARANYALRRVNGLSQRVILSLPEPPDPTHRAPDTTDAEGVPLAGGHADRPAPADYTAFFDQKLAKVRDVSILVLPGVWIPRPGDAPEDPAPVIALADMRPILDAALAHCEATRNRMVILDPPRGSRLADAEDVEQLALVPSTYATLYYPWVEVSNPLLRPGDDGSPTIPVAPSAFAAGMWAKIDGRRGVWKAPAGVETSLLGVAALQFDVGDGEQDQLNPLGVNALRKLPGFGHAIWGARTLSTQAAPEWRYVPVRRTAIFLEQSVYNNIQWAVFEPNDHKLWASLRGNIDSFLNGLWRAGAFQGEKASDAYFVRCGLGDTMTQGDIDRGQVIVVVGFAPLKPAEFVLVRIQQLVGQQ